MSKIVSAVGAASLSKNKALAQLIQAAMSEAVIEGLQQGLTTAPEDADALRARMLAAREAVLSGL